jgi:hypothetical protein
MHGAGHDMSRAEGPHSKTGIAPGQGRDAGRNMPDWFCAMRYSLSTMVTLAMPPPSHMVCKP